VELASVRPEDRGVYSRPFGIDQSCSIINVCHGLVTQVSQAATSHCLQRCTLQKFIQLLWVIHLVTVQPYVLMSAR